MTLIIGLFLVSACSSETKIVEDEPINNSHVEYVQPEEPEANETVRLASTFWIEIDDINNDELYDYIIGHEDFYFNTLFLYTRWNSLVDDINWSFGWGFEAYEYIRDNYDMLWDMLKEQLRSEVAITFLAYQLGYEADSVELDFILEDMELFLVEARNEGIDVDAIFLETFGSTKETWEIQVERQLASIAMIDSMWEEHPLVDEMIERLVEDMPFGELPMQATVYHILVDSEEEAQLIYEKMQEGVHPRDLHAEFSQDPGGPAYTFPRGVMVQPFEDWAFYAEAGDIGIIATQFGFHVSLSYGKELYTEELEHLARLHFLDLHIIGLIQDLDIRWGAQPGDSWVP